MYGSSGFRLTGASCFVLLTVWLLVYYRTLDNFSTGYAEIVVASCCNQTPYGRYIRNARRRTISYPVRSRKDRCHGNDSESWSLNLSLSRVSPQKPAAVVIILHTPATEVPLDICLHWRISLRRSFLTLIAALDAAYEFAGEQSCSRTPTYVVDHAGSHAKHVGIHREMPLRRAKVSTAASAALRSTSA